MGRGSSKDQTGIDPRRRGATDGGEAGSGGVAASGEVVEATAITDLGQSELAAPDQMIESKRGIEYRWKVGEPGEDGYQQYAVLSVSHTRAGRRMYYPETNSPAMIVARLSAQDVSQDPSFPQLTRTRFNMSDPRQELLMKVAADRFSKKELAAVAEEALGRVTGDENAFRSEAEYRPDAAVVPEVRINEGDDLGGGDGPPPGSPPVPPRDPDDTTYSQPDRRFRGPAYNYLRKSDKLPTYEQIADEGDPICRVKLFSPSGRYTYYVAAATNYEGQTSPTLTGYVLSPLGPDADEWGDAPIGEMANVKGPFGLPIERDIHFKPMRLSEIQQALADGKHV